VGHQDQHRRGQGRGAARHDEAVHVRQAEAEREKRAKIIHAEGEFQAAQQLQSAAAVIAQQPTAIQLRYLQTLTEIAVEKNSTIIFPVPIEFLGGLGSMLKPKE